MELAREILLGGDREILLRKWGHECDEIQAAN
jgi:hypothetical protein